MIITGVIVLLLLTGLLKSENITAKVISIILFLCTFLTFSEVDGINLTVIVTLWLMVLFLKKFGKTIFWIAASIFAGYKFAEIRRERKERQRMQDFFYNDYFNKNYTESE